MPFQRSSRFLLLLFLLLFTITACQHKESDAYFQPLFDFVTEQGYSYDFAPLSEQARDVDVPIYNETVWYSLKLGKEELLVYFDTSNRAKQLSQQFCEKPENGKVIYVGMRFIICYRGNNEEIQHLMDVWQKQHQI